MSEAARTTCAPSLQCNPAVSGTCIWGGPVTLASQAHVGADAPAFLALDGVVSGAGGLTKVGPSSLGLRGTAANTYQGETRVFAGQLFLEKPANVVAVPGSKLQVGDGTGAANADVVRLNANGQLKSTLPVDVRSSGLLDLNSFVGEGPGANQVFVNAPGQFSNNNDDGNLNYDKGDITQALGKVSADLTMTWRDFGFFARGYYFYDTENRGRKNFNPAVITQETIDAAGGLRRVNGVPASRDRDRLVFRGRTDAIEVLLRFKK